MTDSPLVHRLFRRGIKYSLVGILTFFIDIAILYVLIHTTSTPYPVAVAIGFLVGISINFYICYHWVYRGTERKFHHGYLYFISLALLGTALISLGTAFFIEVVHWPLYLSRVFVGFSLGTIGFFINTFYNFKLP